VIKLTNGTLNSGYWQWNNIDFDTTNGLFTQGNNNKRIEVQKEGIYNILCKTCCNTSSSYSSMYINGSEVARTCCGSGSCYDYTFHLNEFFQLKKGDYIEICQGSSNQNIYPYNSLTIQRLY